MSTVTITLSDNEDGTVNQAVSFEGGVDQDSQAHIYASIMLRMAKDVVDASNQADQRMPKDDVGLVLIPG